MAFFNDFKELFASAAQSVSNKTRDGMEITRIAGESRGIANDLASLYEEIGRLYVDTEGRDPEALAPLCRRVLELREKLEDLERQRMQLRNQNRCPSCGAAAPKDARFCSACGRRMPEETPEVQSAPDLEEIHYCPECGAMKKEEEKFCPVCGWNREERSEAEEAEAVKRPASVTFEDSGDDAPDDFTAD